MIAYEWVIETMDGEDIADVSHRDTFREAQRDAEEIRAKGKEVCVGLVRDLINDIDEDIEDRQWAYLEDGKLPERFDGGAVVPKRFHKEIQ